MKAVYKCPGQAPGVIEVDNDLKALQGLVEGYIEVVTAAGDFALIANEEGVMNHMPFNCYWLGHMLFGPILFVGVDGDKFCSLTDEQVRHFLTFGGLGC